jgi:hypothetical protein
MGEPYRQCIQCGKRALSIATRCPGCGCEFPAATVPEGGGDRELRLFVTPRGLAAGIAVVAVLASARLGGSVEEGSIADFSDVASSIGTTAPLESATGELLVARGWTNVRKSRSVSGVIEAMLMPGDTVLADSLQRGWYRVALEGEVLGYAHRSTLTPPGAPPEESGTREDRPGT